MFYTYEVTEKFPMISRRDFVNLVYFNKVTYLFIYTVLKRHHPVDCFYPFEREGGALERGVRQGQDRGIDI